MRWNRSALLILDKADPGPVPLASVCVGAKIFYSPRIRRATLSRERVQLGPKAAEVAVPNKKSAWKQVGDYASLGVMLPASTVTGYFIGLLLDRAFGTNFLYIVFLILGSVAGFVEMFRIVTRNSGPS